MRAVIQRVSRATVSVAMRRVAAVGHGICVLVAVAPGDSSVEVKALAKKVAGLRIFEDQDGKIAHSLPETGGEALVVSQFTLLADCRKGRRPSFSSAAPALQGKELYEEFVSSLRELGVPVQAGVFQAHMRLELVNDGPFTLILDTQQ